MKRLLVIVILMALLAIMLAGCGGNGGSGESGTEATSESTGGPVSTAESTACATNRRAIEATIQQYYAIEGEYPTSLQQLVPEYMQSIPTCPAGGTYTLQDTRVVCTLHGS
ncbi:MAG: hypothetical protein SWK76_01905 [Actinomycetota bacterium]|nr:hypothetical protein [Actinomycetota bacterium]